MTVIRPRYLAVAAAAGLVLTATAGGVGYAAGSTSSNVSACVSSKGRLAVQNTKGKCPKKFKKLAIAKQGTRGATGAKGSTGAKGATGARGPGAVSLRQNFIFAGNGTAKTVDGITYTPNCNISGGNTTATLFITAPSGKTATVRGVAEDGALTGATTSSAFSNSGVSVPLAVTGNGGQVHNRWLPGALVMTDTTTHTVTMRIYANPNSGLFVTRCAFEGTITPAA